MKIWNNIIHTAMIGTDKKKIGQDELVPQLEKAATLIAENSNIDKEEKFLQIASVAFNYRQTGVAVLKKTGIDLAAALPEEKQYCSNASLQIVKDILSEESIPLLSFWLQHCNQKNKIVPPEIVPALFSMGMQYKKLQPFIVPCSGKRGEWLCHFNEEWNFSAAQTLEELWQTGRPEQRKYVLAEIRATDPERARELLQQTWTQEDAGTKVSFLEILSDQLSENDIPFLESLSTEKGKKVKDEAVKLLKKIPGSQIVQQYLQLIKEAVVLKKERALLGMMNKTSLQFQLPAAIDDAIFKSGIEKLSSNKEFTDDEFIIYQLIQFIPPSFWAEHFNANPEHVINYFQKDAVGKKMIPALVLAISNFKRGDWAVYMMQYCEVFYIDLIPYLPAQQQEFYSNKFFNEHPDSILQHALANKNEWSLELAKNIFTHTAKNLYQYNRTFYSQNIHLIPAQIVGQLERCTPSDEYMRNSWVTTSEYITKLIGLKTQTIKSFNE